ncbi:MAG TPA: radical SAM family heme chaperone HemW [Blastocatellia bacterium]|nr:radical SAM family heme chaperone HemW [Blastocatellia bacterium]
MPIILVRASRLSPRPACYNSGVQKAGIYIHIPFCERKCTYCNFNTTDFFDGLSARYAKAVAVEIARWGGLLASGESGSGSHSGGRPPVDTIFFGGGTPSIIEAGQLASLVDACRASFDVEPGAEITIEVNPATFSRKKLEEWRASGINRASVGVQSFIDRELASLSRTHTAADARRTLEGLREAGFDNVSLDLIAGLPEQTEEDWAFNLREALALRPEHLSLYLLEVKHGTQLYGQIKRGARPRPDDDLAAEMYRMTCEATREAGYEQYEISNFASLRNGPLRSKHNMKYWTGAPFYGMGCGAHSYDGRDRWVNVLKTESYIERVESTGRAIAERNTLSDEERASEALFMQLRLTEGISLPEFRSRYGLDVVARHGAELERLAEAGLVEVRDERLRLTDAGLLLSNEVFVAFV